MESELHATPVGHITMRSRMCKGLISASLLFVSLAFVLPALATAVPGRKEDVNRDSAVVADFEQRVAEYEKIHKAAAAKVPALKPTASPEKLVERQKMLAAHIRAARPHARQGNIFTPAIAAEFRRLIDQAMQGSRATRIESSLQRGEPVKIPVAVDRAYPAMVPVQNTPPSLLSNLPKLPPELEFRIVGHELVLHDIDSNLVVDYIPNAIP